MSTEKTPKLTAVIHSVPDKDGGGYWGQLLEIPAIITDGESVAATERNLRIALFEYIDALRERHKRKQEETIVRPLAIA
ncbi:MAG: type II toxin-antitoxin system HicB family antitoxin [Bacteroidota bacterium]